ncbi:MAG TPA: hypothetical protein VNV41_00935 [Candidatus Acidoferrales bacterium]|nr:hypothetical protein [Candidatus Acidoferrales bacterium]
MQSAGGGTSRISFQEIVKDALRYWERRRVIYNLVLAGVVLAWLLSTWPHFRGVFTLQSLDFLCAFATLANICYCAAYVADVPMQYSLFHAIWRRWRWSLWLLGMIFAVAIANYWIADEIYPYVR